MGEASDQEATRLGLKTKGNPDVHLGFTVFLASDGVRLTSIDAQFASAAEAERYFELVVAKFSKVSNCSNIKSEGGKGVGLGAEVVQERRSAASTEQFAILLTRGACFREIESTSLRDALALEQRYPFRCVAP